MKTSTDSNRPTFRRGDRVRVQFNAHTEDGRCTHDSSHGLVEVRLDPETPFGIRYRYPAEVGQLTLLSRFHADGEVTR